MWAIMLQIAYLALGMHKFNTDVEKEWFGLVRQGQPAGLEALFRAYHASLCRTALRIINEEAAAEDMVQDFFLYLWQKQEDLVVPANISAYLHRSIRNRCLNFLRDQKRIPKGDGDMPEMPTPENSALADLELAELQARVNTAIDALPERCRLVFVLKQFEDMSYKEIAEQLDISPKTVENQMSRAYKFLRDYLSVLLLCVLYP